MDKKKKALFNLLINAKKSDSFDNIELSEQTKKHVSNDMSLVINAKELDTNIIKYNYDIKSKQDTIQMLKDSELCVTCSRPLEGVDNTTKIDQLNKEISVIKKSITHSQPCRLGGR